MLTGGTGWRKIVLGIGLLGAILGVAWQDAAKEKRAALESVNSPPVPSPETQD